MRSHLLASLALLAAACGGTSDPAPAPAQPVSSTPASIAVLAVGSTLKAYLPVPDPGPDGHGRLLVVDAASRAHAGPAFLKAIDLGVEGTATAVAASSDVVVATSSGAPIIWFIDPVTDTVVKTLPLPAGYGAWGTSDETGYMMGPVIDPAGRRAFVSVWNGFIVLDLVTRTIAEAIVLAPSEAFAFDARRNRLIAPFYFCPPPDTGTTPPPPCDGYRSPDGTPIVEGINVVNLTTRRVYTYVDPAALDQSKPAGAAPDSAAVDLASGRAMVALEGQLDNIVLDLGAAATFDDATSTFTAPALLVSVPTGLPTALAAEPGSQLVVGVMEGLAAIAAYDLPAITGATTAHTGALPDLPWGAGPWQSPQDPHGLATGVFDGKPTAWLVNAQRTWVARVDLARLDALLKAKQADLTPAEVAPAVTYLFTGTAP